MAAETKQAVVVKNGGEVQKSAPRRVAAPLVEMERLFERIFPRGWLRPSGWESPFLNEFGAAADMRMPRTDVLDGEQNVMVRMELPGVDKKDLEVSVNETSVSVRAKVAREAGAEKGDYFCCEIGADEFSRTVTLPCAVNASKSAAQLRNGLLELTLPKAKEARRHAIKIN